MTVDETRKFISERIGHHVRRAVTRALRAAGGEADIPGEAYDRSSPAGERRPARKDEARLVILRMLKEGKITTEQAESLLRAVEQAG